MGKLFARAVCSVLLFVPAISFALGLGPITMRSSLNQPLDAEIDIHSAQPGDLDGFAVRLASVEDFARVNVDRSVFLTQIQFRLKLRSDGSSYIHLTTTQRVTEPYLDFLIEARWPRGRALKEYTVLVDPPVLTAETPAPVEQASTAPVFAEPVQPKARRPAIRPVQPRVEEPVRQQQQIAKRPPAPPPVRRAPPAPREEAIPEGDIDYGRVKRGDTLYEIARDTKAAGVSINQMMLAYLRDNPEAFIDGNINKLKAGYVLRIKDATTIADVSSREAVSEVRRQNLAWREGRGTRLVKQVEPESGEGDSRLSSLRDELEDTTPKSKSAESAAKAESTSETDGPKVVLAKKDSEAKEGSAGSSDKQGDEASKVKEDLLLAAESLDATNQETKLLDERMVELDEQLQSMQRLIMLKDEELLSLQNMKAEGKVDEAVDKAKQDAQKQAAATPPKDEPKKEESLIPEELLSDPILLGLAGLLVVAVVGWLVVRRRRMHGGFEESILNVGAGGAAAADEGGPESAMVSDFVMSDMPSGAQIDSSEVDAISEADVYLAYGRHQQAEDILRQALDKNPDQLDLHAKMLEVHHAAKNADAFEEQARMLHEKIGGDTTNSFWSDIEPLGREICPHSELFGGAGGAPDMDMGGDDLGGVSAEEEDLLDFDFNEDSGIDELSAAADTDSSDDSLDFDMSSLDFDMDSPSEPAAAEPKVAMESAIEIPDEPAAEEDTGLDFDLSFGDDDAQSEPEESVVGMDMETTTELEAEDNSLDFDTSGFDMETDDAVAIEEEAPLDLSMDMEEDSAGEMSLEMDQGADIVQLDTGSDEIDLDGELDEDIFSNVDEVGTKLDLAKAYVDMGDSDGARSILDEVLEEGDDSQKQQAEELLQQMG